MRNRLPLSSPRLASYHFASLPANRVSSAALNSHDTVLLYGIRKVVIGENRTFKGPEDYVRSRGVDIVVIDDEECRQLMEAFIREHPELWNEDIGK